MYCVLLVPQMACEKLLDVVGGLVPPTQVPAKTPEDQGRVKAKARKGNWLLNTDSDLFFYPLYDTDI